jgi:hypothetical protein
LRNHKLIDQLVEATDSGITGNSILAISWVFGRPLNYSDAQKHEYIGDLDYRFIENRFKNDSSSNASPAATMSRFTPFNPANPASKSSVRRSSNRRKSSRSPTPRLQALPNDAGDHFGGVAVFISATLRSIVLPIRLVLTVGWTVAWAYGLESLVFKNSGIYWVVPLMMTTIVIGLGCDYDIFLFTRISELRAEGKSADRAIAEGYYHTGEVITGAGLVMAIAFSGLIASGMPTLRQMGVFLASSVLLDTFIVRMVMVPPLLHYLGRFNWWPNKYSLRDYHEDTSFSVVYAPLAS